MRIAFQPKPESNSRLFIRISEFSFEAYPVQVSKTFRAAPGAPVSKTDSRPSRQWEMGAGILRRVTAWLSTQGIGLAAAKKGDSSVVISAGLDSAPTEVTADPVA